MSVPNPALVREALEKFDHYDNYWGEIIAAAARAWLDLEGALVIRRDLEPEFGDEWVWVLSNTALEAAISERHRNQRPKCYESLDDDGCYCRATTQSAIVNFLDALSVVAAVAVAMVEDLDNGAANLQGDGITLEVLDERVRQNRKWGPQHHSPFEWLAILGEEVGEACQAAVEDHDWPVVEGDQP